MHILMLPDFYPPAIGGLEKHAHGLVQALDARGHDLTVATLAGLDETWKTVTVDDGVAVHRLGGWRKALAAFYDRRERPFHPPFADPGVVAELRRLIDDLKPDIVHAHGWITYSAIEAIRGGRHDPPLVTTMHDFGLICPRRNALKYGSEPCTGPSLGECVRCAPEQYGTPKGTLLAIGHAGGRRRHGTVDAVLAVSSPVARFAAADGGFDPARVRVVANFFNGDAVAASSEAVRPDIVPADGHYALFVGALNRFKGVEVILDAWQQLRLQTDIAALDPTLVLLGTRWPDTPDTLPPNVVMHTNVDHADVLAAMRHSDMVLSPSVGPDACPTTVLEAMALGRPAIGTHIGGIPDLIVDGETGSLVSPGSAAQLESAMHRLFVDTAYRERLGSGALARASSFSAAAIAAEVEAVYEGLARAV